MLTTAENDLLTRIGPGAPMGELMRRYWHPVAALSEMSGRWTKRIRLLGEDLVLFRDRSGKLGLIGEFCPHRRASLAYGIPTADGIRCPYHGWQFDAAGQCLEQPNEPAGSSFKDKVQTTGYPVETLGGLIFAYLGPAPVPVLPRFEGFVCERAVRTIGVALVPCNWLQIMENSLDPVHTEWLHGKLHEFAREATGEKFAISTHHVKIGFTEFPFGVYKRRLMEGQTEDAEDWRVGHPVIFPTILSVGNGDAFARRHAFQIRVPVDDTHTMHYWYDAFVPPAEVDIPPRLLAEITSYDYPFLNPNGDFNIDNVASQDIMAWVTQGPIADRSREVLGSTDRGVTLYRRMLLRELKKVQAGADPMGVIRDPAHGEISIPVERGKLHFADGFEKVLRKGHARYSPIADDLVALFNPLDPVLVIPSLSRDGS
jgi:5,5'-dehydrodivanillate O-demethylase